MTNPTPEERIPRPRSVEFFSKADYDLMVAFRKFLDSQPETEDPK